MRATRLGIADVVVIEPRLFEDARGAFYESFNARAFESLTGLAPQFVQDNHSISAAGVLRGLHFQAEPHRQGKLVRVLRGRVFDVAVDLRPGASFGQWVGLELSAANHLQLWIPEGFAHGFLALEDGTEFLYKTTAYYHPESDHSLLWNDPQIGIDWPLSSAPLVSDKDRAAPSLRELHERGVV